MSPRRRKGTYHAPRPRRELVTAVLATSAVILFTAIMVFVLGPHSSGSGTSTPTGTVPSSSASTTPSTTPSTTSSTTTVTSTPAATGSTSSTTPGG